MIKNVLIVILISIALTQKEKVPFIPERVKLVDKVGSNYLVRGNLPIVDGKFVMKELKKEIEKVTGVPFAKQ